MPKFIDLTSQGFWLGREWTSPYHLDRRGALSPVRLETDLIDGRRTRDTVDREAQASGGRSESDKGFLYCFHKNNDDSKCEVAHTSLPTPPIKFRYSKISICTGRRLQCDAQSYALPRARRGGDRFWAELSY